jgi:hypothetical protein
MRGFRFALVRAARSRSRAELQTVQRRPPSDLAQRFSHSASAPARPSFGIAFDIDGVILRGRSPIGGAPRAIRRLYSEEGNALALLVLCCIPLKQLVVSSGGLRECLAPVFVTAKWTQMSGHACRLPHSCLLSISSNGSKSLGIVSCVLHHY